MRIQLMAAVSILALAMAVPAFAEDGGMLRDVKTGLTKADDGMRAVADDIKAFIVGKDGHEKLSPVLIRRSMTAHGLLGETVVDVKGEKIGTVKDIILDEKGQTILIVVADGGVLGIGSKVAAFNYSKVVTQKPDGKVIMTLTKDMIDHALDFSYDQKDWAKAKVIPKGSLSANNLLEGHVLNSKGEKVASVENLYFRNAEASQIIVGFNKTIGLGGDLAAIDYDSVEMITTDDEVNFKLTAGQSAWFESFKESMAN